VASERPQRKLAAILAADVAGYSRLAGADEDRVLARLRTLRSDLIDPTVAVHNGRVVKRTGDGAIVEFRSAVDAVNCAVEIQNAMAERNAGVAEDRRIVFRIGIHVGDIVEESDGDLMGDGVNIAARLEGVAKPGGICLSEQAYWQVRGRLNLSVSDLGSTSLKNIAEPIHVYSLELGAPAQPIPTSQTHTSRRSPRPPSAATLGLIVAMLAIAALALGTYAWRSGLAQRLLGLSIAEEKLAKAPRLSIVVLPFANLSGDAEQDYFADGITDDLTTDLSHVFDFVIARNTAMTYKGKAVDMKAIGRELGVRYALEGSVRRVGETITLNAQLISTETGAHVWADRFEGERSQLGKLQVAFVARLANTLDAEIARVESLRGTRERPDNPDAVDLVMRGRLAIARAGKEANAETIEDFEQALKLDPNYVLAQSRLATALAVRAQNGWSADPAADIARAEKLVDQALAAWPDSARTRFAKAYVLGAKRQWDAAILEMEAAIKSDSNFATAYGQLGVWRALVGHAEDGFSEIDTAMKLSPRDPDMPLWEYYICHLHSHLAQWDQAIPHCQQSLAANPQFFLAHIDLVAAYGWLGREAEAKAALADLLKMNPRFTAKSFITLATFFSNNPVFTQQIARMAEGLRKAGLPEQ
jgi:class 3 adenylate cyclase/TolB-like protein/Tfp pilus assembly protein PilF